MVCCWTKGNGDLVGGPLGIKVTQALSIAGERIRDNRLAAAAMSFALYTTIMLVLERRMRRTGGPGIIPFELAGSASRAEDIMTRWGSDGQRAANDCRRACG